MACNEMWALTTYFNPVGYKRRRRNYAEFRRRLSIPLITVELAYGKHFELTSHDSDVLIQLRSHSVLWQKERLLNVALASVPRHVRYVSWLDCDVFFEHPDWARNTVATLHEHPIAQPYVEACDLPRDVIPAIGESTARVESTNRSISAKSAAGELDESDFLPTRIAGARRCGQFGLAWAARKEVLESHGFYDAMILGSGDRAMVCAAYGRFDDAIAVTRLNARRAEHYRAWAEPYHRRIRGHVGCVPGRLLHLWHGDISDRRYVERHVGLADVAFDPTTDIEYGKYGEYGPWEWTPRASAALREYVRRYFESRMEDGQNVATPVAAGQVLVAAGSAFEH